MRYSIVPEILKSKDIKFYDERDIEIELCEESDCNYITPFEPPFLVINTFAKKTTKPEEIVSMDIDELKTYGYIITSIKTSKGWWKGQKAIYRIENKSEKIPESKKLEKVPNNHKLQRDIPNKCIRLIGPNAGPNNFGQWKEIK